MNQQTSPKLFQEDQKINTDIFTIIGNRRSSFNMNGYFHFKFSQFLIFFLTMIIFLIATAYACYENEKSLTLYPTQGEIFIQPLLNIFEHWQGNYTCIQCPENVTLWNQFNIIYQNQSEYTTKSLSSNQTNFVTLTIEQTINLYIYKNKEMIIQCLLDIEVNLVCFNSLFISQNMIITDCYNNRTNILQFYHLMNCELVLYKTIQNQTLPQKTKMMIFIQKQQIYLLYAQFYKRFQLLTVFSFTNQQLINQTTWTQGFNDFDVSYRFIYINYIDQLQQLYITQENLLQINCFYNISIPFIPITYIKVQTPIFYYSDYDIIYVAYYMLDSFMLQQYIAQNGSLQEGNLKFFTHGNLSSFIQILISNTFFLFQVDNNITVYEIGDYYLRYAYNTYSNNTALTFGYFDSLSNILYQFSDEIQIFLIKQPSLELFFLKPTELNKFIIESYNIKQKEFNSTCYQIFNIVILQENDKNIYVNYESSQKIIYAFQFSDCIYVMEFTGPLMKSNSIMSNEQFSTSQTTFLAMNVSFSQSFEVARLQYIGKISFDLFIAGTLNRDLYFYFCQNSSLCTLVHSDTKLEYINQIQIIFFYQSILLVGVNQGINDIRIYYFNVNSNGSYKIIEFKKISIYTFPAYNQFLFTYDNIIVLLESQNIIIQSLTSSDQFTLGDKEISQLFPNYDIKSINFKPIQMAMNVIDLSSILYINNQNSVIIVVVQSTYEIIPYAILIVDYQIYQINIIVSQLILSYECEINICFEEWNVLNLKQPQFIKILPSIKMQRGWQIVSDNLFLYVKSQHNTMYVFNPALSYHDSLYYEFNFTGDYFSSIAIEYQTIFLLGNQFFQLYTQMQLCFQATTSNTEQQYLQQTLIHFTVSNNFSSASTPKKLLLAINTLTKIQLPQNQDIDSTIHVPSIINLEPQSLVKQSGSIIAYNIMQNKKKQYCYLKNYIEFQNKVQSIYQPQIQPLWIFMSNNTLIMQGFYNMTNYFYANQIQDNQNTWIKIYSGQINYTKCCMPQTYYEPTTNINQISQICFNNYSWYFTQFSYDNKNFNLNFSIQLQNNFSHVQNLISIYYNTFFFFQARSKFNKVEGVYVTNLKNNSTIIQIECTLNYGFFSYTIVELEFHPNYYLIMFICQQNTVYQMIYINSVQQFHTVIQKRRLLPPFIIFEDVQLLSIQVLSQEKDQIIFLLNTIKGPCFIFQASYFFSIEKEIYFHIFFSQIIQTIPPYGNYQLTQSTPILNGLMFFTYISNNDKVYAIYDLTSVHKNITNPLLMKGGYNSSLPLPTNIAFNFTSIQEGGQFYELINNTINNYSVVGNAYLNCTIDQKKDYSIEILAYNSFSYDSFNITYHVTVYQWYIGLLIFLAVVFTIAAFVFWYNTRDLQNEDNFLEEVELELNE